MATANPMISIIIVNWNTRDLVLQCIRSIIDTTHGVPYEIIVVDNASSDGSAQAITSERLPVRLIALDRNVGFAAGNNKGLAEAKGEFVLLLNPDTIVQGDAIREMRDFLIENPDAGAVGCGLVNPDGSRQESYWTSFPSVRWTLMKAFYVDKIARRLSERKRADSVGPLRVAHLLGACIMSRLSALNEMHGFDESYFLYLEETDLCYRITKAGLGIYYLPGPEILHFGQQSSMQASEWAISELYSNTCRFMNACGALNATSMWLLRGITFMGALVRIALWTLRLTIGRPDRHKARRMLSGYWRLILEIPRLGACDRTAAPRL